MPPEKTELVKYAVDQFNKLRNGSEASFPTEDELAQKFGYQHPQSVKRVLSEIGITKEEIKKQSVELSIRPSMDLSWMLGVLCGGGSSKNGRFFLQRSDNPELLAEFQAIGQRLFQKEPQVKQNEVRFFSKQIRTELGDLTHNVWTETIRLRHSWILTQETYAWKFIEGLFDAKGHLETGPGNNAFYFRTNNFKSAEFIKNLLISLGIQKSTIHPKEQPQDTDINILYTIGVFNIKDLKVIAANIYPKSPEKQTKLKAIDELPNPVTPIELYAEWVKEESPSSHRLAILHREGKTKFSRSVYERILGNGSFTVAKRVLRSGKIATDEELQQKIIEERRNRITSLANPTFEETQKLIDFINTRSKQLNKYGISEDEINKHLAQIEHARNELLSVGSDKKISTMIERLNLLISRVQRKISLMTPLSFGAIVGGSGEKIIFDARKRSPITPRVGYDYTNRGVIKS